MPRAFDSDAHDDERAFWSGLDPKDLRALLRAPLDPYLGFALPERLDGSGETPAATVVRVIARLLSEEGVPVAVDGSFDGATVRAIDEWVSSSVPDAASEDDVPYVRTGRQLAEAAGLIERRKGRLRVTPVGRRHVEGDADALLPLLFRAWARRPLGRASRFAEALHATWPVTVLLLQRFGERSLPVVFYAAIVAKVAPEALAATPVAAVMGEDHEETHRAFVEAYVSHVLARFAAFFGLVELSTSEEDGEGVEVTATDLLYDLLEPAVEPAPASEAVPDWDDDPVDPIGDAMTRALEAAVAEREFANEEELRAFVERFIEEHNAAPIDDFDGLSSLRMQALLEDPFGDDSPLVVADVPRVIPRSPLLHLVLDLADALGDDGLKATQRGNLPRAYVLAALERYEAAGWGVEPYMRVRGEEDFRDLHLARVVARLAGLVTLRRGRWYATKALRSTMARSGTAGVYAALFRTFVTEYAWNSADLYPDLDILQASWAYSLLQLLRHGAGWRDGAFYAERFTHAFPAAVAEVVADLELNPWRRDPDLTLAHVYELRVLERFAVFLGLAEVEVGRTLEDFGRVLRVRATPALGELVAERRG